VGTHYLVRDPNRSTRIGDVVTFRGNWRVAKRVKHLLLAITQPFGTPLSARPPIPTLVKLVDQKLAWRVATDERQASRGRPAALKRIAQREQLVKTKNEEEKMRQEVLEMPETELGKIRGRDLGQAHVAWALKTWAAEPSNEGLLRRVRSILEKAYQPGAWPRWDAEMLRLQQLATLMSLLQRSQHGSKSASRSSFLVEARTAYQAAIAAEISTLGSAIRTTHGQQPFAAAQKILQRISKDDYMLLPKLIGTSWLTTAKNSGVESKVPAESLLVSETQSLVPTPIPMVIEASIVERLRQLNIGGSSAENTTLEA
jgi:hypothetical protein